MERIDRIIDAYNRIAESEPEALPEALRPPMLRAPGAREWYRISAGEWEDLKPLMDARVEFRVKFGDGTEKVYDRSVADCEAVEDGSGRVWIRPLANDWGDLLRVLILMDERIDIYR